MFISLEEDRKVGFKRFIWTNREIARAERTPGPMRKYLWQNGERRGGVGQSVRLVLPLVVVPGSLGKRTKACLLGADDRAGQPVIYFDEIVIEAVEKRRGRQRHLFASQSSTRGRRRETTGAQVTHQGWHPAFDGDSCRDTILDLSPSSYPFSF